MMFNFIKKNIKSNNGASLIEVSMAMVLVIIVVGGSLSYSLSTFKASIAQANKTEHSSNIKSILTSYSQLTESCSCNLKDIVLSTSSAVNKTLGALTYYDDTGNCTGAHSLLSTSAAPTIGMKVESIVIDNLEKVASDQYLISLSVQPITSSSTFKSRPVTTSLFVHTADDSATAVKIKSCLGTSPQIVGTYVANDPGLSVPALKQTADSPAPETRDILLSAHNSATHVVVNSKCITSGTEGYTEAKIDFFSQDDSVNPIISMSVCKATLITLNEPRLSGGSNIVPIPPSADSLKLTFEFDGVSAGTAIRDGEISLTFLQ